jgi:hypothetical protein
VVKNLMSSTHVNMGIKLKPKVDESTLTWLGFYPPWSTPGPLREDKIRVKWELWPPPTSGR